MIPNDLSYAFAAPRSNAIEIALGQLRSNMTQIEDRVAELRQHERDELIDAVNGLLLVLQGGGES